MECANNLIVVEIKMEGGHVFGHAGWDTLIFLMDLLILFKEH